MTATPYHPPHSKVHRSLPCGADICNHINISFTNKPASSCLWRPRLRLIFGFRGWICLSKEGSLGEQDHVVGTWLVFINRLNERLRRQIQIFFLVKFITYRIETFTYFFAHTILFYNTPRF